MEYTGLTVKRLSTTRWSAHTDTVKPVIQKFNKFVEAIEALCGVEESGETIGAVHNLLPAICDFSFLFFWGDVLQLVNLAQKYMQTPGITLDMVATKLRALKVFLEEQRTNVVDSVVQQALAKCEELDIPTEKRIRRKRRMPGEEPRDAGLSLQLETKKAMLECLDRFHIELDTRGKAVNDILRRSVRPYYLCQRRRNTIVCCQAHCCV